VFTRHNFTNYTQSQFGALLVTNATGIIGGRDDETDDDFRYRIHLKLTSQSGINEAALRYQLLQLPGIQDVVFVTSAGSFEVYLYAISPVVPPSLLALANSSLAGCVAFPVQASAMSPDLVGISFSTTLSFTAGTAPADQAVVLSSATTAAANYINNLAIGQPLIINQITAQILGADQRIRDVGQPNDAIPNIFSRVGVGPG
jgi:hypothetical protein